MATVAVLAFVITSGAAGSTTQHKSGSAKSAHSDATGDGRFATDMNAAQSQYGHHKRHHHHGRVPPREAALVSPTRPGAGQFVSATKPTTQAGLPFTGENVLEVIALGLLLLGGGLLITRQVRRPT